MRSCASSTVFALFGVALLGVAPVSAADVVRRQGTTTTNESDIAFTIQTDIVLESTSSPTAPFSNSTFTSSSSAAPSTTGDGSPPTSTAYSTFTIPQSGGGVITSTAFAAPSTSSRLPAVQDNAANYAALNLKEAGLLGALGFAAIHLL